MPQDELTTSPRQPFHLLPRSEDEEKDEDEDEDEDEDADADDAWMDQGKVKLKWLAD